MSSLLDLPIELLVLILEQLGGRELRRGEGSTRLTVCKTWYSAALPVYLSGFGTSNVQLYGHNIENVHSKFGYSGLRSLRPLMHKNTRNLRIHLLGHPWDEATARADKDGDYTTWNSPPGNVEDDLSTTLKAVEDWRDIKLKPCLDGLFDDLQHFEVMEKVVVEARSEPTGDLARIPHRDYVYVDTISRLVLNLPITHSLVSFTLDTYGTELLGNGHACELLADVILRIENVRLRMARVCPSILKFKDIRAQDMRLQSLTIKLHSPQSRSIADYGSVMCAGKLTEIPLSDSLVRASQSFLARLDLLAPTGRHNSRPRFRISHVPVMFPWVHVVDCSSWRQYRLRDGWHACEDDGKPCWFEMEGPEVLVDCEPYDYR